MMDLFHDIAIPIAWPDQTARGDEAWMSFFKRIGIVKNLNFKVGHAAIVLIERSTGHMRYYDFGRYLSPRGYGRARSVDFDPRLMLTTLARWDNNGELANLEDLLLELYSLEEATHGAGRLLGTISKDLSYKMAAAYADELVKMGVVKYGALAAKNNSCSRFVAQVLCKGMRASDARIKKILYPECLKASPTSNVVNAADNGQVFCFVHKQLEQWTLNRWSSLRFQIGLLKPNFFSKYANELPKDEHLGFLNEPTRPASLPEKAHWIGGLGEGCWFHLLPEREHYVIQRFHHTGKLEYSVNAMPDTVFSMYHPFQFTFDLEYDSHQLVQAGKAISFQTVQASEPIKMTI